MKRLVLWTGLFLVISSALYAEYEKRNTYLNGTLFEDVTATSGFNHQGHGKCIAMGDYDKDGDLDIYISVVYSGNKIFQNEGNLRFKDMTGTLCLDNRYDTHGIVWADFDNNSYIDIFVANNLEALTERRGELPPPNGFYLSFDEGFVECAEQVGLAGTKFNYSCGVTTADINGDGLLDIYVCEGGYRKGRDCHNSLYVNNGDGTYRDIAAQAGIDHDGNGYCCAFSDYDNDGDPDLYLGNINDTTDLVTRVLYRNNGDGTFTDVTEKLGIAARGNNISCFWGDVDCDGDQDLFLANSSGPGHPEKEWGANTLLRNNGDGTFSDISRQSGVAVQTNSRGSAMADVDNDGDLDIYVVNSRNESLLFLNDGKGTFTESHEKTGGSVFYGHGVAFGDLDGDGDVELTVGNWRRPSASNPGEWKLFKNKTDNRNFLKINVQGTHCNRSGVMSKVSVYEAGKAKNKQALRGYREVSAGNGTFPGNPLQVHCGVQASKKYDIVVVFPHGKEVISTNVSPGQTLDIVEPN